MNNKEHKCELCDLGWVDEFIRNVREYIFVREEDCVLIKRPNNVQKLNPVGAKILKQLLDGKSIEELLDDIGPTPEKLKDISMFMHAIKVQLEGNLGNPGLHPAVDIIPFEMNFSKYPVLSEIAITYRCNLKCRFCYAGCNCTSNPSGSHYEMKNDEVKLVLDKLFNEAKVPSVSFTGGEPTLCPELPEYVKYAKELGMRVNLITNGTLVTKEMAEELADNGLASVQLSLESADEEEHDRITAVNGSFNKTVKTCDYFKDAGVHTHTNTTINKLNIERAKDIPGFVKKELCNDKFSMNLIIPTGTAVSEKQEDISVLYSEIGPVIENIQKESDLHGVEFMWYTPLPMCIFNTITHGMGNKGCSACDGLISIAPNGDVLPCASFDDPVGNLLKQDFRTIWDSAEAVKYRNKEYAYEDCKGCEDFHICNGTCPLYWREIGYGELEQLKPTGTVNE